MNSIQRFDVVRTCHQIEVSMFMLSIIGNSIFGKLKNENEKNCQL